MSSGLALAVAAALVGSGGALVVMPPEGPSGAPAGWIGHVVGEMIPRSLLRAGVPALTGAELRPGMEALGVPSGRVTRATAIRLAEVLGSSRLVAGSWEQRGTDVVLSLRLFDVRRAARSAPLVKTSPLAGLGRALAELAWDVALAGPRPPEGPEDALVRAAEGVPFEALRALGEALASPDASARVAGARRALDRHPPFEEAALVLARMLSDAGRFEEARQTARRVAGTSPFAREARFLEGVTLLAEGRAPEADVLFAALASEQPTAAALANRAAARLRQGPSVSGAPALLRQALELEPASVVLPFNLGWALLVEGQAEAAAFWLRGAVRRDPGDPHGRLLLSWALSTAGRADEAEEQWRAAVAVTPSLEPLRRPDLGRRLERVLPAERGLLIDPGRAADAEAARDLVARAEAAPPGRADEALALLSRAAQLDPWSERAHLLLARTHRASGRFERAVEEAEAALFCRDDPAVRRELASLLRDVGREDAARRVLGEP